MGKTKPFALFYALLRLTDRSRMSGDAHVRFFEGLGVKFPGATLQKCLWIARYGHSLAPDDPIDTATLGCLELIHVNA